MGTASSTFALKENVCNYINRCKDSKNMSDVFMFERQVCRYFPALAPKSRE